MREYHRRVLMITAQYPGLSASRISRIYTMRTENASASTSWIGRLLQDCKKQGYVTSHQKGIGHAYFITADGIKAMKKACEIECRFYGKDWKV